MSDIQWDIRRKGRDWQGEEVWARYHLAPEKLEPDGGQDLHPSHARELTTAMQQPCTFHAKAWPGFHRVN